MHKPELKLAIPVGMRLPVEASGEPDYLAKTMSDHLSLAILHLANFGSLGYDLTLGSFSWPVFVFSLR